MICSAGLQNKIQIYIGYDAVESCAFYTLAHSIFKYAKSPVTITQVALHQLRSVHDREWAPKQSNEFSFSRWLVPWLSGYTGWSIWLDCDMLLTTDIAELWALRDANYAVQVVKNKHIVHTNTKYLGRPQSPYTKKNWSSMMLFNNARCAALTPEYVNTAHGLDLHQFKWLPNDNHIGPLPGVWNHLVGVHEHNPAAKIVHYTLGGPYFTAYQDCKYAQDWRNMYADMTQVTRG